MLYVNDAERRRTTENSCRSWKVTEEYLIASNATASGGHTAEMLKILDFAEIHTVPKTLCKYIIANSDKTSFFKASDFESRCGRQVKVEYIPRSRHVHQSWITTPFTTLYSFLVALLVVYRSNPTLILVNGPGTCIPICISSKILGLLGFLSAYPPRILFVESFARVTSLSLTGKMLYWSRISDKFLVQWPGLTTKYPRAEYIGRLV